MFAERRSGGIVSKVTLLWLCFSERCPCLLGELPDKPAEHLNLVFPSCAPHLNQELPRGRAIKRKVAGALIAYRTYSTEIGGVITSAHRLVDDMADLQACHAGRIVGVWLSSNSAAHLTCETFPSRTNARVSFDMPRAKAGMSLLSSNKYCPGFKSRSPL
jgi:hypothetical protein